MVNQFCLICKSSNLELAYKGVVRTGSPGSFVEGYRVQECRGCRAQFLEPRPSDPMLAYQNGSYRESYDGSTDVSSFRKKHDKDQALKLSLVGPENFRDKDIADVGCGAGSFLDLVKGMAARSVGIEPMKEYKSYLINTFDAYYPSTEEFSKSEFGKIDLITCFAVIEHVSDPLSFLKSLKTSLKSTGRLCLTTPNRREILMMTHGEEFRQHFYRTAHCWYFDCDSLKSLAERAGFKIQFLRAFHTYDLSNYLVWLREGKASGLDALMGEFSPELNASWRTYLESNYLADQLYMELQ